MNAPITEQLIDAAMLLGAEKDSIRIGHHQRLDYCRFVVKGRRRQFLGTSPENLLDRMLDRDYAPLEESCSVQ